MKWIRPFIITLLAVAITIGFFLDKIDTATFASFSTGLIIFWFKSRDDEKEHKNGGAT